MRRIILEFILAVIIFLSGFFVISSAYAEESCEAENKFWSDSFLETENPQYYELYVMFVEKCKLLRNFQKCVEIIDVEDVTVKYKGKKYKPYKILVNKCEEEK